MHDFHRYHRQAFAKAERHGPHRGCRLHSALQKLRQVDGAHRTVDDPESAGGMDFVRRNSGSAQLRHNQGAVRYQFGQARNGYPVDQFRRSERAFAGGAPDVDALGVEYQQPCVDSPQYPPQMVDGEFIVGGNQYRRFAGGVARRIDSGRDGIIHPSDIQAHPDRAEAVLPRPVMADFSDRSDRSGQHCDDKRRRSRHFIRVMVIHLRETFK
ncbi:hypothetical protein SDC9_133363 [bioreactor metagenome]|uniref:Uncharacterized protein n=1 Tax=bioreactor metagenome TaxID=1076179 RepID=A0A645DAA1_9ZZZZ